MKIDAKDAVAIGCASVEFPLPTVVEFAVGDSLSSLCGSVR